MRSLLVPGVGQLPEAICTETRLANGQACRVPTQARFSLWLADCAPGGKRAAILSAKPEPNFGYLLAGREEIGRLALRNYRCLIGRARKVVSAAPRYRAAICRSPHGRAPSCRLLDVEQPVIHQGLNRLGLRLVPSPFQCVTVWLGCRPLC